MRHQEYRARLKHRKIEIYRGADPNNNIDHHLAQTISQTQSETTKLSTYTSEEGFLARTKGGNSSVLKESTPDQPGDVRVIVKSIYMASRWTGLPHFQTYPRICPKPAQLEALRDETWEELSERLGAIGNKCWLDNLYGFAWTQMLLYFGCLYLSFLIDIREGHYRSELLINVGTAVGAVFVYVYYRLVVSRLKALAKEIDAVVSKFQASVESEGYFLEFLTTKHDFRSYEVRFRPIVPGVTNQSMPAAEKDTKAVKAELFGGILLFSLGSIILSHLLFDS